MDIFQLRFRHRTMSTETRGVNDAAGLLMAQLHIRLDSILFEEQKAPPSSASTLSAEGADNSSRGDMFL